MCTMPQLQALINRGNVPLNPKNDVNAAEDFIEVCFKYKLDMMLVALSPQIVLNGHVVTAFLKHLKMESFDDDIPKQVLEALQQTPVTERKNAFNRLVRSSLVNLIKLPDNPGTLPFIDDQDGVFQYACHVLTYGLLHAEFTDAIREGDGNRIITCWRFFLLLFRAAHRTKYALESATLLIQLQILPERIQKQIIWSHVVNPSGTVAGNIPCDLHMEHLNRTAKDALGQHSHLNPNSVSRVGKCIGLFRNVKKQFDSVTNVTQSRGKHVRASTATDLQKIVKQLLQTEVFQQRGGRSHATFKKISEQINPDKFNDWLHAHIQKIQARYRKI